jgi:Ca2+-transporting ATPase
VEIGNLSTGTTLVSIGVALDHSKWLLGAVALSLTTHTLVIYPPFLQIAFHTLPLSVRDWLIATGVAATLLLATELFKLRLRTRSRVLPA